MCQSVFNVVLRVVEVLCHFLAWTYLFILINIINHAILNIISTILLKLDIEIVFNWYLTRIKKYIAKNINVWKYVEFGGLDNNFFGLLIHSFVGRIEKIL